MNPIIAIEDPDTGKIWKLDQFKEIKNVNADVYERWVVNCVVPERVLEEMIKVDFLEPVLVKGKAVLSLCAIFMRHAAPTWMPLVFGPGSHNCALRVACIDKRDGSQAVWVDRRHTDSFLGPVLAILGFPPVITGLKVDHPEGKLEFHTKNDELECLLNKTGKQQSVLFEKDRDFDEYFCAGVRSYSPYGKGDRVEIIDLHKMKDNHFYQQKMDGVLKTEFGEWPVESVYLTENGLYQWVYEGRIN